jgi:23S rRNA (uracil1939-C5)-methyltransferase
MGQAHPEPADVLITALGAEADGLAALPDGTRLFVPGALPNERVHISLGVPRGGGRSATLEQIITASAERIEAACGHFGTCGGCTLQHWQHDAYLAWKTAQLITALQRAGYDEIPIAAAVPSHPRDRRRMDLAVRRLHGGRIILGLHRLRSNDVVDLTECSVLDPALFGLLPPLRDLLRRLQAVRREASVVANLVDGGADLLLQTDAELSVSDRTILAAFATAHDVPRIAWARGRSAPETACLLRPVTVTLSGVPVEPPPGAFLQATRAGEGAIIEAVLAAVPGKWKPRDRVAELYAGCGTLTFAMSQRAMVSAWEGEPEAVAAVRRAANRSGQAGRIEATARDLARQPLEARELARFAMIVLDPPHAGAAAQMPAIAASKVPVIAYVSCNPITLGRDAAVLRQAGYRLTSVAPVDQFLWSARLEAVAVFTLGRNRA